MMQTLMTTLMTNKTIATAGNVLPAMTEDIGGIIFDEIAHCAVVRLILIFMWMLLRL